MKKLIKLSFIFVLLSIFVKAQAQVIESVSFTPAKTGNYETIATKSVTHFSSGLQADHIMAFGQKLTLDTQNFMPFMPGTGTSDDSVTLNVARDYYGRGVSSLTSNAKVGYGGKLYTIRDAVITNSKADIVYGGDTNFGKITSNLQDTGILYIDNVQMNNPGCAIKWVKLLATDTAHDYSDTSNTASFTDYWFAYCDYSGGGNSGGGPAWIGSSVGGFSAIATCSGNAWDGSYEKNATATANSADGKCHFKTGQMTGIAQGYGVYSEDDSILTSEFYCPSIKIYKCTSSYSYENVYQDRNLNKSFNTQTKDVWDKNSTASNGYCASLVRNKPHKVLHYGAVAGETVPVPISAVNGDVRLSESEVKAAAKSAYNRTAMIYCGFGGDFYGHNNRAREAMEYNPTCVHEETPWQTCLDMAGVTYETWQTWLDGLSDATSEYAQTHSDNLQGETYFCEKMVEAKPALDNLSSFSCVAPLTTDFPKPTDLKAYRIASYGSTTVSEQECKNGTCVSNNGVTYCRKVNPESSYTVGLFPGDTATSRIWLSANMQAYTPINQADTSSGIFYNSALRNAASYPDNYELSRTTQTGYLNKAFRTVILQCVKE